MKLNVDTLPNEKAKNKTRSGPDPIESYKLDSSPYTWKSNSKLSLTEKSKTTCHPQAKIKQHTKLKLLKEKSV